MLSVVLSSFMSKSTRVLLKIPFSDWLRFTILLQIVSRSALYACSETANAERVQYTNSEFWSILSSGPSFCYTDRLDGPSRIILANSFSQFIAQNYQFFVK